MSYTAFSSIYDKLIAEDINYPFLCDFIENVFGLYGISPEIVCDIACGTGSVTTILSERGYDMIGIDKSFDMLNRAREKKGDILYLNQSFENIDLYGTVGAAVCMTDGFNYILSNKSLLKALTRLRTCFMDKGAVLIFDVSSDEKLENLHGNKTYVYDGEDIFYAWENKFYAKKKLSEMTINFFKKEAKTYRRIAERQVLRSRSKEEIFAILEKAGFSDIRVFSGTDFKEDDKALRYYFACQNL
ncbi:MAG: methyltransferase domain-containing protein [Clostridia bacterium]|nr:methyltransferase domain-containing protein [Clostridia bacterium]